ncbi:Protein of unknown function [Gryllus bimaculatus]|nr:Protein of unknown function [Gryllus bimaculatus]
MRRVVEAHPPCVVRVSLSGRVTQVDEIDSLCVLRVWLSARQAQDGGDASSLGRVAQVEEVQLRQRVAREQLDAAQAEVAAAKQLRQEQLQTAQLQRKAAEELLQQQQELHSLRLQTLKHAVAAALSEPAAESIIPSDLHTANSGSDQAAAAAAAATE